MASLDRAYGMRGALLALGMACVAGGVHGVMAKVFLRRRSMHSMLSETRKDPTHGE